MKQKSWKGILVFAMLGMLIILCLTQGTGNDTEEISYQEFWKLAEQGEIASVSIGNGKN